MCKFYLQKTQMNALVVDARAKLEDLLTGEYRGPGDMARALERLAHHVGLRGVGKIWALKYRPPKSIDAALYLALCEAHERFKASPAAWHRYERSQEAPRTMAGRYLVGVAASLDRASAAPLTDDTGR